LRGEKGQEGEEPDQEIGEPLDDAPGTRLQVEDMLADQRREDSPPGNYGYQCRSAGM
jgi:hypothetical protein